MYRQIARMKSDRSATDATTNDQRIMARPRNKLTDLQVRRRTRPGWMSDGGGLYLRISTDKHGGGRRWLLRYTFGGRKREMGLGDLDRVTLGQARDLRDEHIKQLKAGVDPLEAKRAAAQDAREAKQAEALNKTFAEAAKSELMRRQSGWRKSGVGRPSSADTWHKSLIVDCVRIARRPVDEITAADVVAVVKPYWDKGALVSARRVWEPRQGGDRPCNRARMARRCQSTYPRALREARAGAAGGGAAAPRRAQVGRYARLHCQAQRD